MTVSFEARSDSPTRGPPLRQQRGPHGQGPGRGPARRRRAGGRGAQRRCDGPGPRPLPGQLTDAPGPARRRRAGARGATAADPPRTVSFRYRLSEPARVAVGDRSGPARTAGGGALPAAARAGRRLPPARPAPDGSAGSRCASSGRLVRTCCVFRGKVRGRRLPAGRYRASATAERPGGQPLAAGPHPRSAWSHPPADALGSPPWRPLPPPRSSARSWTGPSA